MCLQTNKKCFGSKIKNKFLCWPEIEPAISWFRGKQSYS